MEKAGWDHHDKGTNGKSGGKKDLYKDEKGNVYEKPKGGNGPGEWTGHNLNDLTTGSLLNKIGDGILKVLDKATDGLIRIPVIPEVIYIILDGSEVNKKQIL